jgi:hypothetical protein
VARAQIIRDRLRGNLLVGAFYLACLLPVVLGTLVVSAWLAGDLTLPLPLVRGVTTWDGWSPGEIGVFLLLALVLIVMKR